MIDRKTAVTASPRLLFFGARFGLMPARQLCAIVVYALLFWVWLVIS
jgi:hypothetical protein